MPVMLETLLNHADGILTPNSFKDYCPNGLQVQGCQEVSKLVAGVTANQALIDRAVEMDADAILVHHGFFWNGEDPCITGIKHRRIQALINHNISLIAYHLPLDAHVRFGNNIQLAKRLGIEFTGGMEPDNPLSVGKVGRLLKPLSLSGFGQRVAAELGREPVMIEAGEHLIHTVAWCTGAAQSYIDTAAGLGVDAYLSGEISESTVHSARELGVHYIAAGHHATERYGVQALAAYLADEFGLDYEYVDIESPA